MLLPVATPEKTQEAGDWSVIYPGLGNPWNDVSEPVLFHSSVSVHPAGLFLC